MSRSLALGLALAAGMSAMPGAPSRAEDDHLIVPWQRIGPIQLSMSAAEVRAIMGEPTQIAHGAYVDVHSWKGELSIYLRSDASYITQVCALGPAYATAEGLRPGAPEQAVAAALGQPKSSRVYRRWWKYAYVDQFWPGLMVSVFLAGFDANHTVRTICVNHSSAHGE
jgi:hypothetical protein